MTRSQTSGSQTSAPQASETGSSDAEALKTGTSKTGTSKTGTSKNQAPGIHFSRTPDGTNEPLCAKASAFIRLWHELAGKQGKAAVPEKQAFSIQRLKPFLPNYFLAEWTGCDFVNRLVGSAIDDQVGHRLTGEGFLASYTGEQQDFFKTFWRQLMAHPCGVFSRRTIHMDADTVLRLSGVSLPLADSDGTVRYLCGVGDIARDFRQGSSGNAGRQVYIDHVRYLDLGFGLPDDIPNPAAFNAVTDRAMASATPA